jgi:CDP-glucose 4,6-dehydratase
MSEWNGKSVLVTGASGFIGAAVVETLIALGARVVSLVRNDGYEYKTNSLEGSFVYRGDVSDYNLMCEIISTNEIEYIFHLAANAIVRVAARDPMSTYRANVMGTVALLEAARNVGRCKKIVVASSDKAYGDHDVLPYVETMALQPRNTYDTSKACTDLIARSYAHNYDMPIVVTRCSNVYGPGDPNQSRIIPNTIERINRGERPILYSDVSVMEREFIYIDDVVDACLRLALSDQKTNGQAYNVGGTGAHSVQSVVEEILLLMESTLTAEIVPREPVFKEILKQYIDATKLTEATGWKPQTTLSTGLLKTIAWYQ